MGFTLVVIELQTHITIIDLIRTPLFKQVFGCHDNPLNSDLLEEATNIRKQSLYISNSLVPYYFKSVRESSDLLLFNLFNHSQMNLVL